MNHRDPLRSVSSQPLIDVKSKKQLAAATIAAPALQPEFGKADPMRNPLEKHGFSNVFNINQRS